MKEDIRRREVEVVETFARCLECVGFRLAALLIIHISYSLEPNRPFFGGLTFYFVKSEISENIFVYKYIV